MRIAELLIALMLGALALYVMWKSGERPSWSGEARFSNVGFGDDGAPQGGFWPFWVAAVMLVCCIWVFVNGVLKLSPPSRSTEPYLDMHGIKVLLSVGFPVFLLVALTDVISIYFSMVLFIFYYIFFLGRHGILLSTAMALVVPFWMFLFFDIAMTRTLPKGMRAVEDAVYVPAGNFFRSLDGSMIGLCFLVGGIILVAASMLTPKKEA